MSASALRSYSGARVGTVSLMELPADGAAIRVYRTPFANEAFPVQGSWRYLVNVNGDHYRLKDVLAQQHKARPLFSGGMTGFYAAAAEMTAPPHAPPGAIHIRSLSWPQGNHADEQGIGPLQIATLTVQDDGQHARVTQTLGPQFICGQRTAEDGNIYALPMISVDGAAFSAIPQAPRQGQPSMRVYGLSANPLARSQPCTLQSNLGFSPGKAVFGFPPADASPARLTYSDVGAVYVFDPALGPSGHAFRLDHARDRVLASAFPGLTRDGRVIYGATWRHCPTADTCREQAGYVIADPYQSQAWRAYWAAHGREPPRRCITHGDVRRERTRFARQHGLDTP
ncbi:MAG: hypothetical protein Q4D74_01715 [Comamonadaceae bacterium]|nr:hypothetical protein [Comamonadaceae bacterium]